MRVTLDDGTTLATLRKAAGPDQLPTGAYCTGGGTDLMVDPSPLPLAAEAADRLCHWLETHALNLASPWAGDGVPAREPVRGPWVPLAVLGALGLLWWAAVVLTLPRSVPAVGAAVLAFGLREWLAPAHVLMPHAYPYSRMLVYAGIREPSGLYGGGWPAVMSPLAELFGGSPETLHRANLLVSVLCVPMVWRLVLSASGDRRWATWAAVLVATSPIHVGLAATESYFVAMAMLQICAFVGVFMKKRPLLGFILGGSSAWLLVYGRPQQSLFVLVCALASWSMGKRGLALLMCSAVGVRALELLVGGSYGNDIGVDAFVVAASKAIGVGGVTAVLDPTVTPFWIVPAAAVVFVGERRSMFVRAVGLAALCGAPYWVWPAQTDVLRFQLPPSTWWLVLAALWLARRSGEPHRGRQVAVGVVVVSSTLLCVGPFRRTLHAEEHRLITHHLCGGWDAGTVRYDAAWDPDFSFGRWMKRVCGVDMLPVSSSPLRPGETVWMGRAAVHPKSGSGLSACAVRPDAVTSVPPYNGGIWDSGSIPVTVGLGTVAACQE